MAQKVCAEVKYFIKIFNFAFVMERVALFAGSFDPFTVHSWTRGVG